MQTSLAKKFKIGNDYFFVFLFWKQLIISDGGFYLFIYLSILLYFAMKDERVSDYLMEHIFHVETDEAKCE